MNIAASVLFYIFIGIAIVLITLIVLIFFILFFPIKYTLRIKKDSEENINLFVKFDWIKLIGFVYNINAGEVTECYFRILFFKLRKFNFISDFFYERNEEKNEKSTENGVNKDNSFKEKHNEKIEFENNSKEENTTKKKRKKRFKLKKIYAKAKNAYSSKDKVDIKLIFLYTKDLLKSLFKAFKFKKISVDWVVGLENPADTGYFIGICAVIMKIFLKKQDININGNFQEKCFYGRLALCGKVCFFFVLYPVLKFIFKEPIFKLISNGKEESNE